MAVTRIATAVQRSGGRALMVGGAVRDAMLGLNPKDVDVEVYGLSPDSLRTVMTSLGSVNEVGRSFGVIKIRVNGHEIDVSLPRRDSKTAPGHRGFAIETDAGMDVIEAARRRDFTINAILKDPLTNEVIDPFNGQRDLNQHLLRLVDERTFADDPLRVLRGVQFSGRFELEVEPKTLAAMKGMIEQLAELPKERLVEEWAKLFLRSNHPSRGLEVARQIGYFRRYAPSIDRLAETPQGQDVHPEGTVWQHTLLAVDEAKRLAPKDLAVQLAVLTHDLGKSTTTEMADEQIQSLGHAAAGVEPAIDFLKSQGFSDTIIRKVVPLIREHLNPLQLYHQRDHLRPGTIRRLAQRIYPATLEQLSQVMAADALGRGPFIQSDGSVARPTTAPAANWLLAEAQKLGVDRGRPEPVLWGRDLIERGWGPGKEIGQAIHLADELANQGQSREEILAIINQTSRPPEAIAALQSAIQIEAN